MKHKKLVTIITTTTTIAILIVTMFAAQIALAATTYTSSYVTTNGVLSTDSYVLFPFLKKDLTIGFSKYGEMIDYNTKIGLSYDGYDAFGPNAGVVESQWVEGWILNITYVQGGYYQNVWAMATYSDYYSGGIGGDWNEDVTVGSLSLAVRGGRKTSGGAVTDPVKVLYDGPRKFVALLKTTIYDSSTHDNPLVSITFTIEFNKVKKQVIIFKDVKRIDIGKNIGDMQIEFGDRGEWDLGSSVGGAAPKSYAHFFTNQTTIYDGEYQPWYEGAPTGYDGTYDVCQLISDDDHYVGWAAFWPKPIVSWVGATQLGANRPFILTSTSTKTERHVLTVETTTLTITGEPDLYPQNMTGGTVTWKEDPMVFVNDEYKIIGGTDPQNSIEYNTATNTITFPTGYKPGSGDVVTIVYKHAVTKTDMNAEPNSPFVIGEWAFKMTEAGQIFRGVTIYGITDQNDGDDSPTVLDTEVKYYLKETFNPYDLLDAVHKDTRRWVYIADVVAKSSIVLANAPVIYPLPEWDEYCTFAERVLVNGVLRVPTRAGGTGYTLSVNTATGVGTITFPSPVTGHVKILYSTEPEWGDYNSITFDSVTLSTGELNTTDILELLPTLSTTISDSADVPADPLGLNMSFNFDAEIEVLLTLLANSTETVTLESEQWIKDFKVLSDPNTPYDDVDYRQYSDNTSVIGTSIGATLLPGSEFGWEINANNEPTVIDWFATELEYEIEAVIYTNITTTWFNVTITPTVYYMYWAHQEGQYEWMVVGKDAATIDSAGAAYITQAFDSKKQIHVQMTGLDIKDANYGQYAPYVMGYGSSGTKADYRDSLGRAHLADDWCTTVPVTSSNMLFTGGPRANLGTEYFNDFTNAFYTMGEYVTNDTGHANKLMALSCWDKNTYASGGTYGYAAVSVYKDINGTIGFLIWGIDGQDTYYASKWFWSYPAGMTSELGTKVYSGIHYLQAMNPGVTDIVLRIYYPTLDPIHPTVSVIELLGTISEKPQHDCPAYPLDT